MKPVEKMRGKWGIFAHYLSTLQNNPNKPNSLGRQTCWEECVEELDAELLADQIASTGASWFGTTMHQRSELSIAPNMVFEQITGLERGTATVHRDLPMDLAKALKKCGVDFMLYHTGEGPVDCKQAADALGESQSETYYSNWFKVLAEDARRYAGVVKYWWIDGCYPGLGYTPERLQKLSDILHSYDSDYALGMNYYGCGQHYRSEDNIIYADWFINPATAVPGDDFAAGETNIFGGLPPVWSKIDDDIRIPSPENPQWHLLGFLGKPKDPRMVYDGWGSPGVKYDPLWLKDYVSEVCRLDGALTIDCCVRRDGSIDPEQLKVLQSL